MAMCTVSINSSQSTSPVSSLKKRSRLIEPRLHESYGGRCASEQGFVDSISNCGVGLSSLILSKDHAWLAVEPRALDDLAEEVPGPDGLEYLSVARVLEVEGRVCLHGLHKLVGDGDRDVEVVDLVVFPLAVDELLDVWVVDPEDAHVGPAPGPALLDLVRRSIIYGHERDRPA